MAFLVTGGAGLVGSHLVDALIARGDQVIVFDRFDDAGDAARKQRNLANVINSTQLTIVSGDITDHTTIQAAFVDTPIHVVVHLAAKAGVRPSLVDPQLYERTNVGGTIALLERCRLGRVERFVLARAASVYAKTRVAPFKARARADQPISPYAATKRATEMTCYTYADLYGMFVACLRRFSVYGPRQHPDWVIHAFTQRIMNGRPVTIFGDGSTVRDYTFVSDIVDGVLAALDWPDPPRYEIVNLGSAHPLPIRILIELLEETIGRKVLIKWDDDQLGDVPATCADIAKAGRPLAYAPKVPIREGLSRFFDWYLQEHDLVPARRMQSG